MAASFHNRYVLYACNNLGNKDTSTKSNRIKKE